ncbi:hypothetical protein [uncultured Sphingomonas sp.]|uniref:hypothetical protein n=1 Tax=uncultured Sphingomonas sp. TaxID=158754 RepID=UPI0035C96A9C
MTKLKILITTGIAVVVGTSAGASTPQAWAALDRQVNRACLAASGLTRAKVMSDKASFSDRVPIELRIVEGYNRQSVIDVKLCAFNRRTGRAATVEGVGRLGVAR